MTPPAEDNVVDGVPPDDAAVDGPTALDVAAVVDGPTALDIAAAAAEIDLESTSETSAADDDHDADADAGSDFETNVEVTAAETIPADLERTSRDGDGDVRF